MTFTALRLSPAITTHKDRHAHSGEGCIGLAALSAVTNHPKLHHLPFILETPNDNVERYFNGKQDEKTLALCEAR